MTDIEDLYKEIREKAGLPTFKELDEAFEISDIEETNFFLRKIRRKIIDKIDNFMKVLESLLHPEADFSSMIECREFSEQEIKDMFVLHKRMKVLEKESLILEAQSDYSKEPEFINRAYGEWKILKEGILKVLRKTKVCWEKEESKIPFDNYVG